jgi:hypothetical protein
MSDEFTTDPAGPEADTTGSTVVAIPPVVAPAPRVSPELPVAPAAATLEATPEVAGAAAAIATLTPTAAMSLRVRIDAGGREIELETTEPAATVDGLAQVALSLWKATGEPAPPARGGQFGLVASERATDRSPSSSMDWPVTVPE